MRNLCLSLTLFVSLLGMMGVTNALSQSDYDTTFSAMRTYFTNGEGFEHLPTALRLAFHDCVGGCDGCINLDNESNNGLASIVADLEVMYQASYKSLMSRADFWQLSSLAAVDKAILSANTNCPRGRNAEPYCTVPALNVTFKTGRVDCSNDTYNTTDVHTFPEPTMDRASMYEFFANEFDFSEDEVTALMGAHTLGSCLRENSGYAGVWVVDEARTFNENYYTLMFNDNVTWTNANKGGRDEAKWQFDGDVDGERVGIMLNTDFELLYNVTLNEEGEAGCTVSHASATCSKASTYNLAQTYAQDVTTWVNDFSNVYSKMIEHGDFTLSALT